MFERLKRRRRARRERRQARTRKFARVVLGIEEIGGLEVLELHATHSIIFHYRGYVHLRGTLLCPLTTHSRKGEQVLEIRIVEQECKDYNRLFMWNELRQLTVKEAARYVGGRMCQLPRETENDRERVERLVEWFRKEVE